MSNSENTNPELSIGSGFAVDTEAETAGDIDQVRNLLFGNYSRDYERRFRMLEREISNNFAAFNQFADQVRQEHADMNGRSRDQHMQMQLRMEEMIRLVNERLRDHQREIQRRLDELQGTLYNLIDRLEGDKISNDQLSDLLISLGMQVKRAAAAQAASPSLTNRFTSDASNTTIKVDHAHDGD